MKYGFYIGLALIVLSIVFGIGVGIYTVGVLNGEVRLKNAIVAKQKDNTSEMDNMWKKISQVAQVTDAQKGALLEIFTGYAQARSAGKEGGSLANWIHEAVPNVDTSTFNNLQNLIAASRDRWTMRQKELIDLNREHDNVIDLFPSNIVCSMFGRQKITITVVTSVKTEKAFETGKDDDVSVFQKKTESPVESTKKDTP
jgi:hypothetical protein